MKSARWDSQGKKVEGKKQDMGVLIDSPRKVLVLKSSSLGDIIHALPAVSALRQLWPNARITWLVKQSWAPILKGNPDLNEVWPVDFSVRCWPALLRKLRQGAYDVVVDFQGLFRSGLLSWLSGAPARVGFDRAREGATIFYTDRLGLPELTGVAWRLGDMHAVDRNLALVRHVGADPTRGTWHFPHEPEDQEMVEGFLESAGVKERDGLVGIAPWSRAALKCWPLDRFVEVSRRLITEKGIRPVLIGGPQDISLANSFRHLVPAGLLDCVGKVSLGQLPVLLRHMQVLVGNDSASLHIAAGLGLPVVGLYGPTHSKATGPYPVDRHVVLQASLPCTPCGQQTCSWPIYQECMQTIEVQDVFDKLCGMLSAPFGKKSGEWSTRHPSGSEPVAQASMKRQ